MTGNSSINWKRNQFLKFYAKMKIRVGGNNPIDINKGDEFDYDGTIVKYAGMEFSQPQMRGAIQAGWASLNLVGEEIVNPVTVPRAVAVAKTVNTDLARVQRKVSSQMSSDSLDERTVLSVSDRHEGGSIRALQSGSQVKQNVIPQQDGEPIARVRTSSKLTMDVSSKNTGNVISNLENGSWGRPEYNQKVVREGVEVTTNLKGMSHQINVEESDGEVIGQVRNSNKKSEEGISFTGGKVDPMVAELMAQIEVLKNQMSSLSDPKPVGVIPANVDARIRVARTIDQTFPLDWDFSGKLAERLDRAKGFGITDTFLEALFAAEGDQMRKLLKREFPEKFGNE